MKKKISKKAKLALGSLLLTAGIASSMSLGFANQDIESTLTNWFEKQRTNAIEKIESAVLTEKEIQLKRLREAMQQEIASAEGQLDRFTEAEKSQRIKAIQEHTDLLIGSISIDNSEEKARIKEQLDLILARAINEMNDVRKTAAEAIPPVVEPVDENTENVEEPADESVKEEEQPKDATTPTDKPETEIDTPIEKQPEETATPVDEPAKKDEQSEETEIPTEPAAEEAPEETSSKTEQPSQSPSDRTPPPAVDSRKEKKGVE